MSKPHRLVKVPGHYYDQLRRVQQTIIQERNEKIPLWKCFREYELEKEKWPDARRRW